MSALLALDVGEKRIGVAVAHRPALLPEPLVTLTNDDDLLTQLEALIIAESADRLVVGLPRGMDGQTTGQTRYVERFVKKLEQAIKLPIELQDETLTSVKAEAELNAHGKAYTKGDVDSLSATYILEDYLQGKLR